MRSTEGDETRAADTAGASAAEALDAWIAYLAHERRASPLTLEAYREDLTAFFTFLTTHFGGLPTCATLTEVSAADVRAYMAARRSGERPLTPRSLSRRLSAIRSFYRFADRRLGIVNTGVPLVRGPRLKPTAPRPVTEDQARGLITEAENDPEREAWETARDAALLTLLYGCGLRISEALSLRRADTPLPDALRITGKGGKTRLAPVLPAVASAVDAYLVELPFTLSPGRRPVPGQARRPAGRPVRPVADGATAWPAWPARQRHSACAPPQLRHAHPGQWRRPADDPGAARPRLALHHPEVHGGGRRRPAGQLRQGASAGVAPLHPFAAPSRRLLLSLSKDEAMHPRWPQRGRPRPSTGSG